MKCLKMVTNKSQCTRNILIFQPLDHSVQPALSHCKPVDQAMDEYNMNRKQLQTLG